MRQLLSILVFTCISVSAQSRIEKWGKAEIDYTIPYSENKRDYSYKNETGLNVVTKTFIMAYWFFISDVDGDNCPFHPSCSNFFLSSVKETNIVQGTLMFADRFTRDLNFVNRGGKYPLHNKEKYYDPPSKYDLSVTQASSKLVDNKSSE